MPVPPSDRKTRPQQPRISQLPHNGVSAIKFLQEKHGSLNSASLSGGPSKALLMKPELPKRTKKLSHEAKGSHMPGVLPRFQRMPYKQPQPITQPSPNMPLSMTSKHPS